MSLEHFPARRGGHAAYTISEFCAAYRLSRSKLYQLWTAGIGPRFFRVGAKILISNDAAVDWRREREAEAAAKSEAERPHGLHKAKTPGWQRPRSF
jgi:hypothetical protein